MFNLNQIFMNIENVDPLILNFVKDFSKKADVCFSGTGPSNIGTYFKTLSVQYWENHERVILNALLEKYEGKIKAVLCDSDHDEDRTWPASIIVSIA